MTVTRAPSPLLRWTGVVLIGLLGGATSLVMLIETTRPVATDFVTALRAALETAPVLLAVVGAVPLACALVAVTIAGGGRRAEGDARPARGAETPARAHPPGEAALQMLAVLQREGRFIDFVQEDIASYSDVQVGAAVRAIHAGCRAALREHLALTPILDGEEGGEVTVEAGFDPAAVRMSGELRGAPPYRGVLRHPGWRANGLTLPAATTEQDATILAPAEVEVA